MKVLKFNENFDFLEKKLNFEIFENFDLFLQFDWPTGNEISSLVGQRWNTEYTSRKVYSLWGRVEKMLFRPISEKQNSLSFNKLLKSLKNSLLYNKAVIDF